MVTRPAEMAARPTARSPAAPPARPAPPQRTAVRLPRSAEPSAPQRPVWRTVTRPAAAATRGMQLPRFAPKAAMQPPESQVRWSRSFTRLARSIAPGPSAARDSPAAPAPRLPRRCLRPTPPQPRPPAHACAHTRAIQATRIMRHQTAARLSSKTAHRVKPGGSRARKWKTQSAASHTWPASGAASSPPGAAVSNSSDAPSARRRTGAPAMHSQRRRQRRRKLAVPARFAGPCTAVRGARAPGALMQVSFAHSWEEDAAELRLRVPLGTAPRAALDVYGAPRSRARAASPTQP